jgi:hypothetical protein
VIYRRRAHDGSLSETRQPGGGVFAPIKEKGITTPAWMYGHGSAQTPIFTCPVSAIPAEVFDLYEIWIRCRMLRVLPHAGGYLDQPWIVQYAWPLFEDEAARVTAVPAGAPTSK